MKGNHQSTDEFLDIISTSSGVISDFVKIFPGKDFVGEDPKWIENWFEGRINHYFSGGKSGKFNVQTHVQNIEQRCDQLNQLDIHKGCIKSIRPNYFRGFKNLSSPVSFQGDLIVIHGKNSTGKTSLAEAFEWCLTGELIRRKSNLCGDPTELENCISHQLKPEGEETWVEISFQVEDDIFVIKRLLVRDYGKNSTSGSESKFFVNKAELNQDEEKEFLDTYFAGVPPILMQHSLGLFVKSSSTARRDYFERLLRLDELTYLIEKAVIGKPRLSEFPYADDSQKMVLWEKFSESVSEKSRKDLKNIEKASEKEFINKFNKILLEVGHSEFQGILEGKEDLTQLILKIKEVQAKSRQKQLPLFGQIKPRETIDSNFKEIFSKDRIKILVDNFQDSYSKLETSKSAAKSIGEAQLAISKSVQVLVESGLINKSLQNQLCPICETGSLLKKRIALITSWQPIQEAVSSAKSSFISEKNSLITSVKPPFSCTLSGS